MEGKLRAVSGARGAAPVIPLKGIEFVAEALWGGCRAALAATLNRLQESMGQADAAATDCQACVSRFPATGSPAFEGILARDLLLLPTQTSIGSLEQFAT